MTSYFSNIAHVIHHLAGTRFFRPAIIPLAVAWVVTLFACTGAQPLDDPASVDLAAWKIISSSETDAEGATISMPGFDDSQWIPARVPGTVAGALMEAGLLGDPLFGTNLQRTPGWTYSFLPMPEDSPYRVSWWYRTEFEVPDATKGADRAILVLEGVNYAANLWVNGTLVTDRDHVSGTFREFGFDVTGLAPPGSRCAIAVEVFAPDIFADLSIYWVDWNPEPPDYNMGLWMPARLELAGPVSITDPAVLADLDETGGADLTLIVEATNSAANPVDFTLKAVLPEGEIHYPVSLAAGESRSIRLSGPDFPALRMDSPELWWPYNYGNPHLYRATVGAVVDGAVSDAMTFRFGVREVTAEIIPPNSIRYFINGKPILILGAGWAPDIFLRDDPVRDAWEIAYVKDMGLNAIRLEGKLEDHAFYDLCDREGVLLMPGWCCCDTWETWDIWTEGHMDIAAGSLENQLRRLRRHPSVFTWLNGSDFHPTPEVESMYLTIADKVGWNLPVVSNATETASEVTGASGMKMTGPYNWVPPNYWYLAVPEDPMTLEGRADWEWLYGGAFGFNSESSPGPAVPPMDSLLKMLEPEDIWPVKEPFLFHSGGISTATTRMKVFNQALAARLGPPTDAADYAFKSQIMAYESHRAMFEAQGRNKYFATGFIQWMLNNAWPGTIWHLYDYFLRPGGSYFGAKTALRPIHVQYSYDDHSVWLVNATLTARHGLTATATLYSLDSRVVARSSAADQDLAGDGNVAVLDLADAIETHRDELAPVFFLDLRLADTDGNEIDRNFYWLSTTGDLFDMVYRDYELPDVTVADMTALAGLAKAEVAVSTPVSGPVPGPDPVPGPVPGPDKVEYTFNVTNTSESIAFFVEVLLVGKDGNPILPATYSDNYFSLVPGEKRPITVTIDTPAPGSAGPSVTLHGWNVR